MAIMSTIGTWLEGSEWDQILVKADVTTSERAKSLLKASHVKRTRFAHQVSAVALYIIQREAYSRYCEASSDQDITLNEWRNKRIGESSQFVFWNTTLEFELLLLQFVKSVRLANISLFLDTLLQVCPWFFACDHVHYARWIPVFI